MLCSKASSKEGHVVIMMDPHCRRTDPPSVTSPMCVYTCVLLLGVLFWLISYQFEELRRQLFIALDVLSTSVTGRDMLCNVLNSSQIHM